MKRSLAALALLLLAACAPSAPRERSATAENYLEAFVDPTVDPRQDFFGYAVGKWLKDHPIPASERSWGIAKVVQEETYRRLVALSEEAAARGDAAPGSNARKIGDFWHAAMDSAAIDAAGLAALADEFAAIEAAGDRDAILRTAARLHRIGVGAMLSLYIFQDEKNSERYALHLYQGGLGLPSREHYFDDDERTRKVRAGYEPHVARMFGLLGEDSTRARASARTVMAIETELARASRRLEDLRDPHANYHAMAVGGLARLAPSVRWREFFENGSIPAVDTVVVGQPEFLRALDAQLRRRSVDEWKTYLRWHLLNAFAEQAGGRYDAEHFRFFGTVLNGTAEQRPRWKRMLDAEEQYLGDALGQLYVERHYPPRTRERYERLTSEIFDAFRDRVRRLEWMSAATQERALRKLDAVTRKVGRPERWRDYSAYEVSRESFLANCKRGNAWLSDFYAAKLGKPVDRTEWEMTPQTYNAYYNPSNNEIVMPAAVFILPGIADSLVDDALVYGYAGGTTIGHEITHGFDDTGRQFDERGNLVSWWTPEDEREFRARAARIVRQFDAYVAVDSLHVNGEATQGENIADLGGIELGWDAFTKTAQYREGRKLGGLTPAQRYFVGWALGWMNQLRPENLALRVKTDVHAPSFLRVIGPVTNLPQFYEAYGVQPGDPMFRPDSVRVKIW